MQLFLLKIALVLGVRVYSGFGFVDAVQNTSGNWELVLEKSGNQISGEISPEIKICNVLIGADGGQSIVREKMGFGSTIWNSKPCIGITSNCTNNKTPEENSLREFGISAVYGNDPNSGIPCRFSELKSRGIELENLVYYRGPTHYFVMTPTAKSLVNRNVVKQNRNLIPELIRPDNINEKNLTDYVREILTHIKIPSTCPFAKDNSGKPDIALFDFGGKRQALTPAKILGEREFLVILCGDALVEPFWPQGTGANRAIQSALDAAWMVKGFFKEGRSDISYAPWKNGDTMVMTEKWKKYYNIMRNVEEGDLVQNFSVHTIDPKTRYKNVRLI